MTKQKNNIVIPKSLTPEEVPLRMEVHEIKVKLLDKEVWNYFSKEIILRKNRTELAKQYFGCSEAAAEFLMSLTLMDFMGNTPDTLEKEHQLLLECKAYK
jgi:hypothetical protein